MDEIRQREIDANYDFFQRNLARFMDQHLGQYALLRHAKVIDFFAQPGEAYRAGLARFPDEIFSIQEVRSEPIELGHMAFDLR